MSWPKAPFTSRTSAAGRRSDWSRARASVGARTGADKPTSCRPARATDYLVTVDTNRYSVPFTLIGQPVEVRRRDGCLQMRHRGQVVATHPVLGGRHQLRILPEHGPGPIARNARVRYSTGGGSTGATP